MSKFAYRIFVTTSFPALHYWSEAPDEVAFLRQPHRHLFKVRAELTVTHDDRELEFILIKRRLDAWLMSGYPGGEAMPASCESIAEEIAKFLGRLYPDRVHSVEVSEDGENGSVVVPQ